MSAGFLGHLIPRAPASGPERVMNEVDGGGGGDDAESAFAHRSPRTDIRRQQIRYSLVLKRIGECNLEERQERVEKVNLTR